MKLPLKSLTCVAEESAHSVMGVGKWRVKPSLSAAEVASVKKAFGDDIEVPIGTPVQTDEKHVSGSNFAPKHVDRTSRRSTCCTRSTSCTTHVKSGSATLCK